MFNRRKSERLEISVTLQVKLLGISKHPPTIETITKNISPVGISMELQVMLTNGVFYSGGEKPINLIPYLVLENKEVELEITLPPDEEKISVSGKVLWYDFTSREALYFFEAGIVLNEMEVEARKKWQRFIKNTGLATGRIWQHIQLFGTFTFFSGIFVYIAGFWNELATTAKIGIFLSLIGLIGFVFAWWRRRSFMLLKQFKVF